MDIVRIVGSSLGFIHALVVLLDKNKKLAKDLSNGINFIQMDLEMIKNLLEQDEQLHLQPEMQLKLQELAYDIDDFVKGLCVPKPFGGFFLTATGTDIRPEDISSIDQLKSRATDLGSKLDKISERMKSGGSAPAKKKKKKKKSVGSATSAVSSASPSAGSSGYLVGIGKPKQEIVDLLSPRHETLKVISIVGCSGLGKTALAKALYKDEDVVNKFDHKAWIVASDNSPADNLNKILQQLHRPPAPESTSEDLQHVPENKRYLLVLDDVQQSGIVWKDIEEAFRGNKKGSRIILTTRAHSVAAACSPGSHLYRMKCLGQKESEELLWTKATNCPEAPAHLAKGSEEIILKCGGLPLALISAGEYLSVRGLILNRDHCADLGRSLGEHLVGDGKVAFQEMKRALVQSYDKLTKHDLRNCLLYLSIFPRGHHINSKSLVRKLIAEELVGENGRLCLDELIDHGMIEEVLFHDDCDSEVAVERCKAHSVVLEYTIKKAVSRNFVSLVHEKKLLHNSLGLVRRLTVQSDYNVEHGGRENQVKLSSLRSLTIFDTGILDFKNCRVIRVLDLEGCNWINKKVVDETCELVFLKYLSLRNTGITILPKAIKNLMCLETMDIRDTSVKILPIQAILLPQLAFLFGRFELPKLKEGQDWIVKFLRMKSKLKTLAGIVINRTQDFEIIILHARHLEKVKIWFKVVEVEPSCRRKPAAFSRSHKTPGSTLEETNTRLAGILVSSLQKRFNKIESVSIHFNWSKHQTKIKDFLGSMHANCIISSIKLWGKLESLPEPDVLSQLANIRKLHLFNTGLSITALVVLQNLQYLQYLKMAEDAVRRWDDEFVVQDYGFPALYLLSLQAPKLPKVIFQKGSMPCLNSLQLLCPGSPVKVEDISDLPRLNEVILHHSAPDTTVDAWKDAATSHANRPFVRKQVISKKRKEPPTNIIAS